ncbi:hypothetical protein ACWXVJ_00610 [Mycoplasma sp. 773]
MRKSSKLLITLCTLNVGAIIASVGISISTTIKQKPRNALIKKIKEIQEELVTNKRLSEEQKVAIKQAIEEANKVLIGQNMDDANFENAISQLVSSYEAIIQNFEPVPDIKEKENSKNRYNAKLQQAMKLSSILVDSKYEEVKKKIDGTIQRNTNLINDKTTKDQYDRAAKDLEDAITEANMQKKMIDDSKDSELEKAKKAFESKKSEADELSKQLIESKFVEVKSAFDKEVQDASQNLSTKDQYNDAINKLEDAINKAKKAKETILETEVSKAAYDAKVAEAEKFENDNFSDSRYSSVKNKLHSKVAEIKTKLGSGKHTKTEYDEATRKLEDAITEANMQKKMIDDSEDSGLEKAKKAFESKKSEADELSKQLIESKFVEVKSAFDKEVQDASQGLSTKDQYNDAINKLEEAINKAKKAKETILETEESKTAYDAKVAEVEKFENDNFSDSRYSSVKDKLHSEVAEIKTKLGSGKHTKKEYDEATRKLEDAITEANKQKKMIDDSKDSELESAKKAFESKKSEADELSKQLIESKFVEVKSAFDKEVQDASQGLLTKDQYNGAINKLEEAIKKAKKAKETILETEESKTAYDAKVKEVEKFENDNFSDSRYSSVKNKLHSNVEEIKTKLGSGKHTKTEYDEATKKLEELIANAYDEILEIGARLKLIEKLHEKVAEAERIAAELGSNNEYKNIKGDLEKVVKEKKDSVNVNNTRQEIGNAISEVDKAIKKAKSEKNKIDKKLNTEKEKKDAEAEFMALEGMVEDFLKALTKPSQMSIKTNLENELNKQKQIVNGESSPNKIKKATEKLTKLFEQAKLEANKAEEPDDGLTQKQKDIVNKLNNKTLLKADKITEEVKNHILEVLKDNSKVSGENFHYYFGYIEFKKNNSFEFSSKKPNKKNKNKIKHKNLGIGFFDEEFIKLVHEKEIIFPTNKTGKSARKALALELKSDGKIVLPFKFKDHTKVYEIELFTSNEKPSNYK